MRVLIDHPWVGGKGRRLQDVANMTIDQVLFELTDRDNLRNRRREVTSLMVASLADRGGLVKGRDAEGKPMEARIVGRSLARRLAEEAAERKREKNKGRRRGR